MRNKRDRSRGSNRGQFGHAERTGLTRRRLTGAIVVALVAGLLGALVPGHAIASAQPGPEITGVSPIVAQNESLDEEVSGPGVIITGSGFGSTPPNVSEDDNDTTVGESALGLDTLTGHLLVVDTNTSSDMGLYPDPNSGFTGDCNVSIGVWTDTEIVVLLDDTGFVSCSNISSGDSLTFEVWDTNEGADPGEGTASNVFTADPAVDEGTPPDITCEGQMSDTCGVSPASGPICRRHVQR